MTPPVPTRVIVAQRMRDTLNAKQQAKEDSLANLLPEKRKALANVEVQKKKDAIIIGMPNTIVDRKQLEKIKADSANIAALQHSMDSIQNAMNLAKNNALALAKLKKQADSVSNSLKKAKSDSLATANKMASFKSPFVYAPEKPHSVVIFMNKVDPVYINETKNAFTRYNQENFYNQQFQINNLPLDDSLKMVIINGFANANLALDYMEKARKSAAREIVPWLPVGKYSFLIISDQNL